MTRTRQNSAMSPSLAISSSNCCHCHYFSALCFLALLWTPTAASSISFRGPKQTLHYHQKNDVGIPVQMENTTSSENNYDDIDLMQTTKTLPPKNPPIHILPPSPDDTPLECVGNATLYSSCGTERYCAKLPHHSSSSDTQQHDQLDDFFLSMNGNNTNSSNSTPHHEQYFCLHKTLWDPQMDIRDLLSFLLTGSCCFLAAMAGIGGGGLILPILLICCNFTPKEASVLSNTAVFCNTLGQFLVNNYWHSSTNSSDPAVVRSTNSLVYATVLMIMPGVIAGGSVAITLEGLVPSTVILILALLTLLLASTKTYFKAQKMRKKEQEQEAAEAATGLRTPPLSPIEPAGQYRQEHSQSEDREYSQHDILLAAALEWGSMLNGEGVPITPASGIAKSNKNGSELLDPGDTNNSPFFSEPFFGSIGKFNRENPDDNCALIIDESSTPGSFDANDEDDNNAEEDNNQNSINNNLDQSAVSYHLQNHAGCCGRFCTFCSNHKLQLLIGIFWIFDATTFLLLHTGTLISTCSTMFFVLMSLPALFAVVFVGLARCHLLALQQPMRSGDDDVERRPLLMSIFSDSQDENDSTDDDPVPIMSGSRPLEYRSRNSPLDSRKWVLLLPLVSTIAGIVKAFQDRSSARRRRQYQRNQSSASSGQEVLSMPLLEETTEIESGSNSNYVSFATRQVDNSSSQEHSIQDDYKSLMAWWLPWASVLIGLLAALLGIGGGELLGPILLLLLQMDPQQSSATTAIMSMMNSGTNLLHYIVADMMLAPGYAINLGMMGLIGGSMGRIWATSIAEKGRTSIIAISLFLVLSLAALLVLWELATTPVSWKSNAGLC